MTRWGSPDRELSLQSDGYEFARPNRDNEAAQARIRERASAKLHEFGLVRDQVVRDEQPAGP